MQRPVKSLALVSRRTFATTSAHFRPLCHSPILPPRVFSVRPCQLVIPHLHGQIRQETTGIKVPRYILPGDWICSGCQAHNFSRRMLCFECQAVITDGRIFYSPGDWHCPTCNLSVGGRVPKCRYNADGQEPQTYVIDV